MLNLLLIASWSRGPSGPVVFNPAWVLDNNQLLSLPVAPPK